MKTCDILACTEQGIYFVEFKPVHGITDVHDKMKGTHKLLSIIYNEFNVTDLQKIKVFLVSCDNGKDPNKHFKAALFFLTQKNISSSLYDNGSVTIDGYKIPISYHRTCTDFINEGLEHHFPQREPKSLMNYILNKHYTFNVTKLKTILNDNI